MYFCVNEFEVRVNDSIFSGNEQQKVHYSYFAVLIYKLVMNWKDYSMRNAKLYT